MESPIKSEEKNEPIREEPIVRQLEEMLAYGSSYVDTRIDGLKSSARETLKSFFIWSFRSFSSTMILLIAVSFIMYGVAMTLGRALGGDVWLGFILTGGVVVLGKLVFSKILLVQTRKISVKNHIKKYEQELKIQRDKFGHDMSANSQFGNGTLQSEGKFLIWKAAVARSAFLQTKDNLKQEISESIDVKEWTKKYPFYSTGVAAATGFIIAGGVTSQTGVEKCTLDEKTNGISLVKTAFVSMLANLTEEVLKDAVVPLVKESIHSFSHPSAPAATQKPPVVTT